MPGRLEGKAAIVTGAASGIGRACALRFAREGASVVVADIAAEGAADVARLIAEEGGRAVAATVDAGVEADLQAMVDAALDAFGRIDILFSNAINTAAAASPSENDFLAFDPAVFEAIVRVNVLGGVLACKHAIPHMIRGGGGAILFTSSTSAFGGDVGQFSYGASKAMVNWYVRTIATSFGKQGVRCNAIVPGVIQTPSMLAWANEEMRAAFLRLHNGPRLGEPEDIAALATFLASDEAAYCNGGLFPADGGITAALPFVQLQRDFLLAADLA